MLVASGTAERVTMRPNAFADDPPPIAAPAATAIARTIKPQVKADECGRRDRPQARHDALDGRSRCSTFAGRPRSGRQGLELSNAFGGEEIGRHGATALTGRPR